MSGKLTNHTGGIRSSAGVALKVLTAEPAVADSSNWASYVGTGLPYMGIWAESDGIHINYNGVESTIATSVLGYRNLTEVVTETNTITAAESGKIFFLNSATEFNSVLPAPAAGLNYKFIVSAAPVGASYTISTNASANVIVGMVNSSTGGNCDSETSGADTITFADGVATKGDYVDIYCDGTNWYAYGFCDADAAITITTAG